MKYMSPVFSSMILAMIMALSSGCSLLKAWDTVTGPSDSVYQEGRLAECPAEPNCVSTQSLHASHAIVPFTYSKSVEDARKSLIAEMTKVPRTKLIKEEGPYLHFECRSSVLQMADDVEFYFDDETKTLQFRSASRFGYSDWDSNRKRMEDIRNKILGHI